MMHKSGDKSGQEPVENVKMGVKSLRQAVLYQVLCHVLGLSSRDADFFAEALMHPFSTQ